MSDDRSKLQGVYARATGLKHSTPLIGIVPGIFGDDVNGIVSAAISVLGNAAEPFKILPGAAYESGDDGFCDARVVHAKLGQLISYLEQMHHVNSKIVEIGSLYNSIKDEELRNRCSDLLSATGHFDRVINQATLVLEDRIRTKSGIDKPLVGVNLVNVVLNSDPNKALLRISDDVEEHEGVCHMCRGIVLTFRNPTHHHVLDKFTREDALKVCAFIDNLLQLVDAAIVKK